MGFINAAGRPPLGIFTPMAEDKKTFAAILLKRVRDGDLALMLLLVVKQRYDELLKLFLSTYPKEMFLL